jgi:C4-dicarboxylate-specific signal transduction histidine kinase
MAAVQRGILARTSAALAAFAEAWRHFGKAEAARHDADLPGPDSDSTREPTAEIARLHATHLLGLGEMASGLVHEINQPLNVIGLALANIRRRLGSGEIDTAKLAESLARAESNVARARTMVSHLRTLGRSGAVGRSRPDLREVVDACLGLLAHSLRQLDINVTVDLAPATLVVEVDRTLISQILLNLLTNARDAIKAKAAPDGARWIRIRGTRSGERVELSIADAGGGIPAPLAERVFEPYFTTRPTDARAGLGLTLSRTMAQELHGTLCFHNEGEGVVFVLSWPDRA